MDDLLAARMQMAMSLGFHIIFACVGIGMPLLMVIAEALWIKTGKEVYLTLAKRWAKGTAIMFAVGAVSGTVLSFELSILWPNFMSYAGAIIGMPFSLEGFAFFVEAIFLGIYFYGWDRVSRKAHWLAGVMVMISGAVSGIFVVMANAWMNNPTGFELVDGKPVNIDPIAAMFNSGAFTQTLHMTIAAFLSVSFCVAGVHAYMLLRRPNNLFHRRAFSIALVVGTIMAVIQPISGHLSGEHVVKHQPLKFAAIEAQWETETQAPLKLGGWPDQEAEKNHYAIEIPYLVSILAHGDPNAEVKGIKEFPRDERPPVAIVHTAFQIMVGCGVFMMFVGILGCFLTWRCKKFPDQRWYLRLIALCSPLGFIAVEAGWTVTEVGRQPWIIYNVMRTAEAVTPVSGLEYRFAAFTVLYIVLFVIVVKLLRTHVLTSPQILVSEVQEE